MKIEKKSHQQISFGVNSSFKDVTSDNSVDYPYKPSKK
jgi:hypothetical protein